MFRYPLAITLILLALFDLIKTLPADLQAGLHLEGTVRFARKLLPFFDLKGGICGHRLGPGPSDPCSPEGQGIENR